jgi:ABC-type nitrate/sulfonate/bicarbonate transport system permease component
MKKKWLLEILVPLAVIFIIWWWSLDTGLYYFPPLPEVLRTFADSWVFAQVGPDLMPSLGRLFLGLILGLTSGIVLGLICGRIEFLAKAASPMVEFCRAIPAPAVVPVLMLVLGLGTNAQVALIAFGTVWPVLISTMDGVRSIDPTLLDTGRSYRIPQKDILRNIVLPAATPQILAGIKTSLSLGIILMVISEMVGSTNGVGYFVLQAQRQFSMPEMWAGIILLGLLGYLLNAAFEYVEGKVLVWHRGAKQVVS